MASQSINMITLRIESCIKQINFNYNSTQKKTSRKKFISSFTPHLEVEDENFNVTFSSKSLCTATIISHQVELYGRK